MIVQFFGYIFAIEVTIFQIVIFVSITYLMYRKFKNRRRNNAIYKIPTYKFNQITGHAHYLLYHRFKKLPLPVHVYDFIIVKAHVYSYFDTGITTSWLFDDPQVFFYKAELIEPLLNSSTELKKGWVYELMHPWLGTGLLTSMGDKWKQRRKQLTPAFHFDILRDFLPIFNKKSRILVNILEPYTNEEYIDIVPVITRCSLDIICESILGKEIHSQTEEHNPYIKAVVALTNSICERVFNPFLWPDIIFQNIPFGKRFKRNKHILHDFTNKMIAEKKKLKLLRKSMNAEGNTEDNEELQFKTKKKKALLDLLLDEHIDNNSISEDEIRDEVSTFTFEGHDTTSMGISWCLYLIGLHPWVQEKIHIELDSIFDEDDRDATEDDLKNMKYLECVFKESVRLYPPVPVIIRELIEDLDIGSHVIPKRTTCAIFCYMLHRNPKYFFNPEKFDPDRFLPENCSGRHPFAYIPFSAGPRNCIGQRFALMEVKTVLSSILRNYKVRSLDPRDRIHLVHSLVLRPNEQLKLQIRRRNEDFDFKTVYYKP